MKDILNAWGIGMGLGILATVPRIPLGDPFLAVFLITLIGILMGLLTVVWPLVFIVARSLVGRDGLDASTPRARVASALVVVAAIAAVGLSLGLILAQAYGPDPMNPPMVWAAVSSGLGYFPVRFMNIRAMGVRSD